MMKKIWAAVLALMILAMSVSALASGTPTKSTLDANGEQGVFEDKDTPIVQDPKVLVLEKELKVMDLAAFTLARDHNLPIRVFNMNKPGTLKRIILGSDDGTLIHHVKK